MSLKKEKTIIIRTKLYSRAKKIVKKSNNYSITHLQRRLGNGYECARVIIKMIEDEE